MKFLRSLIILFFVFAFHNSNAHGDNLDIKITKNLRCLICQGQSVYDSDSEFANSVKVLVSQKLDEGLSEKINMGNGYYMNQNLTKIPIFFGYCLS